MKSWDTRMPKTTSTSSSTLLLALGGLNHNDERASMTDRFSFAIRRRSFCPMITCWRRDHLGRNKRFCSCFFSPRTTEHETIVIIRRLTIYHRPHSGALFSQNYTYSLARTNSKIPPSVQQPRVGARKGYANHHLP